VSSLQTEKENLEKKVSGLHIEKENLEKQVSTLIDAENRSESLNQELQQTKVEVQNLEKLKHSLENLVTEKDLSLKAVRSELSQSQTSSDELLQQVAACKSRIEELNKAINEESVKLKSSENTVQNLKLEFDKTEARLHEVEKSNKDFLTTIEENIKTISLLEDDKNDLSIQLDSKNSMMVTNFTFYICYSSTYSTHYSNHLINRHSISRNIW
jgi:chromosome segregation ATPase